MGILSWPALRNLVWDPCLLGLLEISPTHNGIGGELSARARFEGKIKFRLSISGLWQRRDLEFRAEHAIKL